jgi:hypothetical protein
LNETATLYESAFALVAVGIAAGVATGAWTILRPHRTRACALLLSCALVATVLASALLAVVQPITTRSDVASFIPNTAWNPAPSPESSFWGSCAAGSGNGVCASGWSSAWGPDVGWYLITVAGVLLIGAAFQFWRRTRPIAVPVAAGLPSGP